MILKCDCSPVVMNCNYVSNLFIEGAWLPKKCCKSRSELRYWTELVSQFDIRFSMSLEQGWASFSHEGPDLEKLLKPRASR